MKRKAINTNPICKVIQNRLEERDMSQADLSRLTRISTPVINDIVQGRRGLSPKQIVAFALILGFDAIELGRMQSDQEVMAIIEPMIKEDEK